MRRADFFLFLLVEIYVDKTVYSKRDRQTDRGERDRKIDLG